MWTNPSPKVKFTTLTINNSEVDTSDAKALVIENIKFLSSQNDKEIDAFILDNESTSRQYFYIGGRNSSDSVYGASRNFDILIGNSINFHSAYYGSSWKSDIIIPNRIWKITSDITLGT